MLSCFHGWWITSKRMLMFSLVPVVVLFKGIRKAIYRRKMSPTVLCCKVLIQICLVLALRHSICRGHQQGSDLQAGWHLALILVLEIKDVFWVSRSYIEISKSAMVPGMHKWFLVNTLIISIYWSGLSQVSLCESGPCSTGRNWAVLLECDWYINLYEFNILVVLLLIGCKKDYCKYCWLVMK